MGIEPTQGSSWDRPDPAGFAVDEDKIMETIEAASTCVFIRNRRDGHPIGHVVGHNVLDGGIYMITNTHRAGYRSVLRDPRICAVFDVPFRASVTVIGTAEIVEDPELLQRFYAKHARDHYMVTEWGMTERDYIAMAYTANRRLVRVMPEKILSNDLSKLPRPG